jgi:flagellar biosynthetic protein FliO
VFRQAQVFYRTCLSSLDQRLPARLGLIRRMPRWGWGLAALALVLWLGSLMNASPAAAQGAAAYQPPSNTEMTLDMLAKLLLVLGLFYAAVYGAKRWRKLLPGGQTRHITVLESTPLSPRQALHLVRVGEQVLLVGATDQGLSLLSEVNLPTVAAEAAPLVVSPGFSTCLQHAQEQA